VDVTDRLTWNTPSWSISAEFRTYILFALIVLLAPRYRTIVFAATAALGAATLVAFSQHGIDATYDLGLPRCIFGFSVGYLVYWARPPTGPMPSPSTFSATSQARSLACCSDPCFRTLGSGPIPYTCCTP
jgi:peptidoglycan/LPS O-acetylase OafA/YrhL